MNTKKYYMAKLTHFYKVFLIMISSTFLFFISCDDSIIDLSKYELEYLGFDDKFALRMVIEEPYLYVCAGSDGVWRQNIRAISDWEYLGLMDTTLGKYTNVGALDIDILGNDILVAYNGSESKIPHPLPPSKIVSIWRSTDSGATWFRSDTGIPESISDSLEYNILTSLQRSPHKKESVVACFERSSYLSKDNARTWTFLYGQRGVFLNFGLIRWHPFQPGEVWFFGETALLGPYCFARSDYGEEPKVGVDFYSLGFPLEASADDIVFDASNPNIVHVTTSHGIISTSDGGYTWRRNVLKLPDSGFVFRMTQHPSIGGLIYLAGGNKIYRAQLKVTGYTVNLIGEIDRGFITSLVYDQQFNQLFIGTTKGGVYVLKFNGR